MVIFYSNETNEILYTENQTMIPLLPVGTIEEKTEILNKQGVGFISVEEEMGIEIFDYKVSFNDNGDFLGLVPIEV